MERLTTVRGSRFVLTALPWLLYTIQRYGLQELLVIIWLSMIIRFYGNYET